MNSSLLSVASTQSFLVRSTLLTSYLLLPLPMKYLKFYLGLGSSWLLAMVFDLFSSSIRDFMKCWMISRILFAWSYVIKFINNKLELEGINLGSIIKIISSDFVLLLIKILYLKFERNLMSNLDNNYIQTSRIVRIGLPDYRMFDEWQFK